MSGLDEKQTCRKLYGQIISGYTPAFFLGSQIYVKHFSDSDFSKLEGEYENLLEEAKGKGLATEEEKIKILIEQGHWTEKQEAELTDLKASMADARDQKSRMLSESTMQQIKGMEQFMGQLTDKIYALEKSRSELIGTSCNSFAQRKNNERIILYSLFKDEELTQTYYSNEEEFADIDQEELLKAIILYNKCMESFTEEWIKKMATLPSFLNAFFLCNDDPRIFFGKPVVKLTIYQTDLFSKGRYYKSILNEIDGDGPPAMVIEKGLFDVVKWYDLQYSMLLSKREAEKAKARASQSRRR